MSALLCSSDPIAALTIVKYDEQPKLFSLIFGEGVINDAVSIILFQTVLLYTSPDESKLEIMSRIHSQHSNFNNPSLSLALVYLACDWSGRWASMCLFS